MDYKEYEKDHFGTPVNIYSAEGQLIYVGMTPVKSKGAKMKKFEGKDNFAFDINGDGVTVEVSNTCIFKLSATDEITTEATI